MHQGRDCLLPTLAQTELYLRRWPDFVLSHCLVYVCITCVFVLRIYVYMIFFDVVHTLSTLILLLLDPFHNILCHCPCLFFTDFFIVHYIIQCQKHPICIWCQILWITYKVVSCIDFKNLFSFPLVLIPFSLNVTSVSTIFLAFISLIVSFPSIIFSFHFCSFSSLLSTCSQFLF